MRDDEEKLRTGKKLEKLEARLRSARPDQGRARRSGERRRLVNYKRRLEEARRKWLEGDWAGCREVLDSLDEDYPRAASISGRRAGGGRGRRGFGFADPGGSDPGGDGGGGDAGG